MAEQDVSSTSHSRALLRAGPLRQVRGDAAGPAGRLASVRLFTCLSCVPLLPAHRPLLEEKFRNSAAQSEHSRVYLRFGELGDRQDLLDVSPLLQDAGAAIVDDSFLRCFQSASSDPWNWNIYLFPLWLVGLLVRHLILFPIRCAAAHCPLLACCATVTVVS